MNTACSVLLVDDDEDLRAIFQRRLERRGMAVTPACDPQSALDAATQQRFDVAVVDRTIPAPGGLALVEMLKRANGETQIIVMSGNDAEEWADTATQLGACGQLVKPFSLVDLEAAINRAVGRLASTF